MQNNLSKFAHLIIIDDETWALFNSLWLRVIFIESKYVPFLETLRAGQNLEEALQQFEHLADLPKLVSMMSEEMFFDPEADQTKLDQIREAISQLPIGVMYLITSLDCNLACTYCYLADSLNPEEALGKMSNETAKRAIDVFARLVNEKQLKRPTILFYGGEPTLNWPVIVYSVNYTLERLPTCEFTINTNGTQLDAKKAQFIAKHNIAASISIDGPAEVHDSVRLDRGGGPTFSKALNGYRLVKEAGGRAAISCTITPANVEQLLDVVKWLHTELDVFSLGFNLMLGARTQEHKQYIQKASKVLIECFKYTREHGIYEDRMRRRVNALADGRVAFNDCAGCGQQLVVTPQNQVGVCPGFMNAGENFIPLTDDFDPHHPLWQQWRNRSPFNISECLECEALGICGGGCPYGRHIHDGNIMTVDPHHCVHAKMALKFMLADLWENN